MVEGLLNLQLTKEEEEEISIKSRCKSDLLEECSLSLFGHLLTDGNQNQRALKNTMRSTWKMGSDLQIMDMGNNVLRFKFGSEYQLKWVEQNGPWNFDNNLLLLCRWRRGLSAANIKFTHSPFWVQIWGLPFELMSEEVGRKLGNSIGRFIEMDRQARQSEQAKFMRIRVDLQLDKPLRRGGRVAIVVGEKCWVSFRYERLPVFCFQCGKLGHDEKHCLDLLDQQNPKQYGDWLRAQGNTRLGMERSKSTNSGEREDKIDGNTNTKEISPLVQFPLEVRVTPVVQTKGKIQIQMKGVQGCMTSKGVIVYKVQQVILLFRWARVLQGCQIHVRWVFSLLLAPHVTLENLRFSLVGQQAQSVKEQMEVSSSIKFKTGLNEEKGNTPEPTGKETARKTKVEANWKRIAREKGKNKSPSSDVQPLSIGSKRVGN